MISLPPALSFFLSSLSSFFLPSLSLPFFSFLTFFIFLNFYRYLCSQKCISHRCEDSRFHQTVRQISICVFFFPGRSSSPSTRIHRRDFAIDSSRSIDTALAPPPFCPLFQGFPSANALAARELLVTSPTYRYTRVHASRLLTHTCARTTRTQMEPELYGERKVRPRQNVRGVLLFPLPSSPGFEDPA